MPKTFEEKIRELEVEVTDLDRQIAAQGERVAVSLTARRASAARSLQWYRNRQHSPRGPRRVQSLGARVHDDVQSHEAV